MTRIELYITIESGDSYKCDIVEHKKHWKCTLYKENFQYEILKDYTLSNCFQKIAEHLDSMGYVSKIEGMPADEMHIAILETHLMINRSKRNLNKKLG